MQIHIGCDLVEVNRFRKYKKTDSFINELFYYHEIEYCFKKDDPYPHLAARFAAKEAVCKAFGNIEILLFSKDIEIIKNKNGSISAKIYMKIKNNYKLSISISHNDDKAIAFCLLYLK